MNRRTWLYLAAAALVVCAVIGLGGAAGGCAGRRAPVATFLYFIQMIFTIVAGLFAYYLLTPMGTIFFFVLNSRTPSGSSTSECVIFAKAPPPPETLNMFCTATIGVRASACSISARLLA